VAPQHDPVIRAFDPHEQALRDYFFHGRRDATVTLHSDLGEYDHLPVSIFFREPPEFFPFERIALDACRGTVLDVGASTGVHSLALQERGVEVVAIEILAAGAEIMQARGVRSIVLGDVRTEVLPRVDTVLMMMNGIGFSGTLRGLDAFLRRARELIQPGGQILFDSGDARPRTPAPDAPTIEWPDRSGSYVGEAWICLEYEGQRGAPFRELYVGWETMAQRAEAAGWIPEPLYQGEGGYVARLTRDDP